MFLLPSVPLDTFHFLFSSSLLTLPSPFLLSLLPRRQEAYLKICISIRQMMPCHVLGLTHSVNILEEDTVEIMISAIVSGCILLSPTLPILKCVCSE
jgi:hypothetical protein